MVSDSYHDWAALRRVRAMADNAILQTLFGQSYMQLRDEFGLRGTGDYETDYETLMDCLGTHALQAIGMAHRTFNDAISTSKGVGLQAIVNLARDAAAGAREFYLPRATRKRVDFLTGIPMEDISE